MEPVSRHGKAGTGQPCVANLRNPLLSRCGSVEVGWSPQRTSSWKHAPETCTSCVCLLWAAIPGVGMGDGVHTVLLPALQHAFLREGLAWQAFTEVVDRGEWWWAEGKWLAPVKAAIVIGFVGCTKHRKGASMEGQFWNEMGTGLVGGKRRTTCTISSKNDERNWPARAATKQHGDSKQSITSQPLLPGTCRRNRTGQSCHQWWCVYMETRASLCFNQLELLVRNGISEARKGREDEEEGRLGNVGVEEVGWGRT